MDHKNAEEASNVQRIQCFLLDFALAEIGHPALRARDGSNLILRESLPKIPILGGFAKTFGWIDFLPPPEFRAREQLFRTPRPPHPNWGRGQKAPVVPICSVLKNWLDFAAVGLPN